MGIIADTYRHRITLLIDGLIYVIAGLMWSNIGTSSSIILLFISQFLLGLGTGSLGVTRSFVSEQCEGNTRTYQLARLSALQYAGFAMTPVIGSALFDVGYKLQCPTAYVSHYWAYALPSYIMTALAFCSVCLIIYPFKDFEQKIDKAPAINGAVPVDNDSIVDELVDLEHDHRASMEYSKRKYIKKVVEMNEEANKNVETAELKQKKYLEKNFLYCYWLLACLNFTTRGILAIYETMSAHILLTTYNLSITQVGYIVSFSGTIGTLNLLFYKQLWLKYFNEFQLMLIGFFFQAGLLLLLSNIGADSTKSLSRFLVSQILTYAFAYPISNSAVLGVFSILQKNGKQSKSQAHFALMGSIARMTMPICSGYFTEYIEPTSAWAFGGVLMGFSSLGVILLFRKLQYFVNTDRYGTRLVSL